MKAGELKERLNDVPNDADVVLIMYNLVHPSGKIEYLGVGGMARNAYFEGGNFIVDATHTECA